jgi:acyl-homoserine-lactone acylase
MIVNFGQAEPLQLLTSSGQSGNPASRHYGDGLDAWFKGRFMSLPLQPQNFGRAYGSQRLTLVPGK